MSKKTPRGESPRREVNWQWAKDRLQSLGVRLIVGVAEVLVLLAFAAVHYGLSRGLELLFPGWEQVKEILEVVSVAGFSIIYLRQIYEIVRVFLA